MGFRTSVSLVINNFVFLFIHTLSFMNNQCYSCWDSLIPTERSRMSFILFVTKSAYEQSRENAYLLADLPVKIRY